MWGYQDFHRCALGVQEQQYGVDVGDTGCGREHVDVGPQLGGVVRRPRGERGGGHRVGFVVDDDEGTVVVLVGEVDVPLEEGAVAGGCVGWQPGAALAS